MRANIFVTKTELWVMATLHLWSLPSLSYHFHLPSSHTGHTANVLQGSILHWLQLLCIIEWLIQTAATCTGVWYPNVAISPQIFGLGNYHKIYVLCPQHNLTTWPLNASGLRGSAALTVGAYFNYIKFQDETKRFHRRSFVEVVLPLGFVYIKTRKLSQTFLLNILDLMKVGLMKIFDKNWVIYVSETL